MKNEIQMLEGMTSEQIKAINEYQELYRIILEKLEATFIEQWKEYNNKLANNEE